jgi:hypothetical protein
VEEDGSLQSSSNYISAMKDLRNTLNTSQKEMISMTRFETCAAE